MKKLLLILFLISTSFGFFEVVDEGVRIYSQDGATFILLYSIEQEGVGLGVFEDVTVTSLSINSRMYTNVETNLITTSQVTVKLGT